MAALRQQLEVPVAAGRLDEPLGLATAGAESQEAGEGAPGDTQLDSDSDGALADEVVDSFEEDDDAALLAAARRIKRARRAAPRQAPASTTAVRSKIGKASGRST